MKGFSAFCAGAVAGFLVGSSKQGVSWRSDLEKRISSLFGNCGEKKCENSESSKSSKSPKSPESPESSKSDAQQEQADDHSGNHSAEQSKSDNVKPGESKKSAKQEHSKQEHSKQEHSKQEHSKKEHGSREAVREEEKPAANDGTGIDLDKAQELAEKLGAKVSEPEGDEALPHAHPIETSTSRLSA